MTAPSLPSWQTRIFTAVWITYFSYYLCRLNMPVAKSAMCKEFGWAEDEFGLVLTALTICYAVGQFVNGQLGDRFGTRTIASLGALVSALVNLGVFLLVLYAPTSGVPPARVLTAVVLFWGLNGFFQAMGWAPMVRVMAHWFPTATRGRTMGLLATCYTFGHAGASLLATFLVKTHVRDYGGDWRAVFLVPSAILAFVAVAFYVMVRNCPEDVGLPPVEDGPRGDAAIVARRGLADNVAATLRNPHLWVVAVSFFFLDVNRYGFVNWLPSYLEKQAGGAAVGWLADAKQMVTLGVLPIAGSLGVVCAGWATDRFFDGRRAPVIAALLTMLGALSIAFTYVDHGDVRGVVPIVGLIGFCTYGAHILMVGHAAQDFGHKHGASGAAGFIDALGYVGASLAGWGAGKLIKAQGYEATFQIFGCAGFLGALAILALWRVGPRARAR